MQFDFSDLLQLAQSPAGQQLITLLQRNGGNELQSALSSAARGDYSKAQKALSGLMKDPEAQKLLKNLEDQI